MTDHNEKMLLGTEDKPPDFECITNFCLFFCFHSQGTCEVLRLVKLIECPSYHSWLRASLHTSLPQKQSMYYIFTVYNNSRTVT